MLCIDAKHAGVKITNYYISLVTVAHLTDFLVDLNNNTNTFPYSDGNRTLIKFEQ